MQQKTQVDAQYYNFIRVRGSPLQYILSTYFCIFLYIFVYFYIFLICLNVFSGNPFFLHIFCRNEPTI